jgi:short-subunit dehydrogenase
MALPAPSPDRTALVTGASSGIGEALARELVARGHGVTLVARRADKLRSLADELAAAGVRAEVLAADLGDRSARAALPARVEELGLEVDVLVNNAGLSTVGPVAASDPEAELHMVEVDVMAVVDLCTRFLPSMVERGRGAVLNVASTAAFQPLPGQAGYGASKAFVLSYTRSLGGELRGTGVTATALCPGPVHTGFEEVAGFDPAETEKAMPSFMWETPESVATCGLDALAKGAPVAIPGTANRITAMVANLAPKQLLVPILASRHPGLKDT